MFKSGRTRASFLLAFLPPVLFPAIPSVPLPFLLFPFCAFSVAGPTVWNSLPDHLRDPAVDSEQFRRELDIHVSVRRTFEALPY